MGFLDGPQRVVVVVHGEASDGLESAAARVVDVVGVQAG